MVLKTYTGEKIGAIGLINLKIAFGKKIVDREVNLHVVPKGELPLLGRDWMQEIFGKNWCEKLLVDSDCDESQVNKMDSASKDTNLPRAD